jgi:diphosphomevalonate decarboxylase
LNTFTSSWTSPSNIALVKYWGKKDNQIPQNSSISFTLSASVTKMIVKVVLKENTPKDMIVLNFKFEGSENHKFSNKLNAFLESQLLNFPWILAFNFFVESENTFPHSSGIASSASSMSAFALCLMTLNEKITGHKLSQNDFYIESSKLARLGSGSACRSLYPYLTSWGEVNFNKESSNEFASPYDSDLFHPLFKNFKDTIVIVDGNEKSLSSRAGHSLMDQHPFREQRYFRANENSQLLFNAMVEGDIDTFIQIVEEEALMLHALLMTSKPSTILLKPNSLYIIEELKKFRTESNIPLCFTIDAGPNVHILYPASYGVEIQHWLEKSLSQFRFIHDSVGNGPINNIVSESIHE